MAQLSFRTYRTRVVVGRPSEGWARGRLGVRAPRWSTQRGELVRSGRGTRLRSRGTGQGGPGWANVCWRCRKECLGVKRVCMCVRAVRCSAGQAWWCGR